MASDRKTDKSLVTNSVTGGDGEPLWNGDLVLGVDNTGARDLAYNPEHHARSKHIERRHFFIREMVENMHPGPLREHGR